MQASVLFRGDVQLATLRTPCLQARDRQQHFVVGPCLIPLTVESVGLSYEVCSHNRFKFSYDLIPLKPMILYEQGA